VTIQAPWGGSVQPCQIEEILGSRSVAAVAMTHVETSTGAMTHLRETLDVISRAGVLAIVDGVAAFGGVPEPMVGLGIDVLLTGGQKALGIPPGLAILGVSEEAWERRERRTSPVPGYYVDLKRWQPVMNDPDKYFSTHSVNLVYALDKALDIVFQEGLPQRFERHEVLARRFRIGMLGLGFEQFTDANHLAPTLSVFRTPPSVPSTNFRSQLYDLGVVAAGGLQDPADRVVRFGHMGNISGAEIAVALDAAAQALNHAG
jgi:aspartate aminotransferase-like enzyme